jgi:transposase
MKEALRKLVKHQVGIAEAALLFAIEGQGMTTSEAADLFEITEKTARGRIGILRKKGLISKAYRPCGACAYRPSYEGQQIIDECRA